MQEQQRKVSTDHLDFSAAERPPIITHEKREEFLRSRKRFDVVPASRRSGKSFEARHRLICGTRHIGGSHHGLLDPPPGVADATFIYCAPTREQAKRLAWEAFKREVPAFAVERINESELTINARNGAKLVVVGMDRPQRLEGIAIDGIVLDEFADMKPSAWTSSVRPALSTVGRPPGWALFIGRPRGRNHFYQLFLSAQRPENEADWGVYYPWPSWVIMAPEEVAAARRELDPKSFAQEYGGEFVDDDSRAYYQFGQHNIRRGLAYDPQRELQLCFDFNRSPGVCVVAQDLEEAVAVRMCPRCHQAAPGVSGDSCPSCKLVLPRQLNTAVVGEVYIEDDSNTRKVCERVIADWGHHSGTVTCYGDATGGAMKTSAESSDWQIIEDWLGRHWPALMIDIPNANPAQRDRLVIANSRLKNAADDVRVFLDPDKSPHTIDDFQSTPLLPNGKIGEGPEHKYSHLSDALTYMLVQRFGSAAFTVSRGAEFTPL